MTTVLLQTTMGDVKIELLDDTMPVTTGDFRKLVEKGFYNGNIFHRVIAGFMIQGGDPEGTGFGGPGYTIKDELPANNRNARGTLSMRTRARTPAGASSSSTLWTIVGSTGSIPSSGGSYPVWKSSTPSPGRRPTARTARGRKSRFRRRPLSREGVLSTPSWLASSGSLAGRGCRRSTDSRDRRTDAGTVSDARGRPSGSASGGRWARPFARGDGGSAGDSGPA